jgi:hypothetical protein
VLFLKMCDELDGMLDEPGFAANSKEEQGVSASGREEEGEVGAEEGDEEPPLEWEDELRLRESRELWLLPRLPPAPPPNCFKSDLKEETPPPSDWRRSVRLGSLAEFVSCAECESKGGRMRIGVEGIAGRL